MELGCFGKMEPRLQSSQSYFNLHQTLPSRSLSLRTKQYVDTPLKEKKTQHNKTHNFLPVQINFNHIFAKQNFLSKDSIQLLSSLSSAFITQVMIVDKETVPIYERLQNVISYFVKDSANKISLFTHIFREKGRREREKEIYERTIIYLLIPGFIWFCCVIYLRDFFPFSELSVIINVERTNEILSVNNNKINLHSHDWTECSDVMTTTIG